MAPHVWQGPTATQDWYRDVLAEGKQHGASDYFVTVGQPLHNNVTGDSAYVVVPATMTFKMQAKQVTQSGAVFTVALRKLPAAWRIAACAMPWHSESRRHHLRVTFVERIDVLAHCRHRIVPAHLCYSVLRCRLRKSSGYLSNRCIRQYWTETTAERDTVEKGTRRCRPVDFAGSCPSRLFRGHCIWSSVFEKAALSLSAFLISSALTYGYSPN
jgi:hypothetical protein